MRPFKIYLCGSVVTQQRQRKFLLYPQQPCVNPPRRIPLIISVSDFSLCSKWKLTLEGKRSHTSSLPADPALRATSCFIIDERGRHPTPIRSRREQRGVKKAQVEPRGRLKRSDLCPFPRPWNDRCLRCAKTYYQRFNHTVASDPREGRRKPTTETKSSAREKDECKSRKAGADKYCVASS